MKAKRFLVAALLSVVGCVFALAGCGDEEAKNHDHEYDWEIVTPATCKEDGERKGVCKICGKETTETIPRGQHVLTGDITVLEPATCTKKGSGTQACSVCGTTQPVEIDMVPHTLEHHDEDPATCMRDGSIEYWHCTSCNGDFADADGTTAVTTTVELKEDVPHQYNEKGRCTVCGAKDPTAPHYCFPEKVDKIESDCKTPGVDEHYECPECGKLYRDEEATQEVQLSDLALPLSKDHKGEINAVYHKEVVSKNCAMFGKRERYDCKVCGRHFKTAELNEEDELFEVDSDEELGDNTLQTPKTKVHSVWNTKHESKATCTSIGWNRDCVECQTCGMIFVADEFNEKSSMLLERIYTYELKVENEDGTTTTKTVIVKGEEVQTDGAGVSYIKKGETRYNVTLKKNDDGTDYIPVPLVREEVTIPIDPQAHSESPTEHVKVANTGCGEKRVGFKKTCYECTYCKKIFEDKKCTIEANLDEVYDFGAHGTMEHSNAMDSTCVTKGHPECYTCKACGEHFLTKSPAANTVPLSDDEYNLPLAPHSFTEMKCNSNGHWRVCSVEGCGAFEMDEDGELLIEEHLIDEDGDDTRCPICGYGNIDYMEFFDYEYDDDGEPTYVIITGLKKDVDNTYFIEHTEETTLRIPEMDSLGYPVEEIAEGAFSFEAGHDGMGFLKATAKITEIVIPNSVIRVGAKAFSQERAMPENKGKYPNIKRIEFEAGMNHVTFGELTFNAMWSLNEIVMPRYVESLPEGLFAACMNLTKLVMPQKITGENVTHELKDTFRSCSALKEVNLWCYEGLSFSFSIGTFINDYNLTTLYIPKGLTSLGLVTMVDCSSVEHIYFGGTIDEWRAADAKGRAWNQGTYNLKGDLQASGVLVCGYTPDA